MNISFGICLSPNYDASIIQKLVDSIERQNFGAIEYEIILIGNYRNDVFNRKPFKVLPFDETIKKAWITRKKNLIAKNAQYENLCLIHDYYILSEGWLTGLLKYTVEKPDWNILCNQVFRQEGDRHSDWLVNQKYMDQVLVKYPELGPELMKVAPTENNGPRWVCGLPYSERNLSHIQYVSGGYILTKTDIMLSLPLDERYGWGEAAEDIIWSEQVINAGHRFDFNPHSSVWLQKPNKWKLYEMTPQCVSKLKELFGELQ